MALGKQVDTKKSDAIAAKKCVTLKARLSYPQLHEAKSQFEGQEPKYSLVLMFDKAQDLSLPGVPNGNSLKRAIHNAAKEAWGDDKTKWPKKRRMPIRDGDEERGDKEGYENTFFVSASSKDRPGLVDQRLQIVSTPQEIKEQFYAGCYVRAELIAFAYNKAGNVGIGLSLQNVQKLADGERLSGRRAATDVFDAVESGEDDEDSYEDDDDDEDDSFT